MSAPQYLFGFHAVGVRLRTAPQSVIELHVDATRHDARMRQFLARAVEAGARVVESDGLRLSNLCGNAAHQGVVARVRALKDRKSNGLPGSMADAVCSGQSPISGRHVSRLTERRPKWHRKHCLMHGEWPPAATLHASGTSLSYPTYQAMR